MTLAFPETRRAPRAAIAAALSAQGLRYAASGGIVADEPQEGAPQRAVAARRYWGLAPTVKAERRTRCYVRAGALQ